VPTDLTRAKRTRRVRYTTPNARGRERLVERSRRIAGEFNTPPRTQALPALSRAHPRAA